MFGKVLIANRGAIACRIIRTLDRMGVASVAVYSEADRHAMHVARAGEAVAIGASSAAESYLKIDAIIGAARLTGAEAIHPGYGFLAENPEFAETCAEAGIVFIGPSPAQMRAFGLKHEARELARRAGVPLAPGSGLIGDVAQAQAEAARIGYPVMLKSTAGGGGIGLRQRKGLEEPAGVGQVPLGRAGVRHRLDDVILRRQRSAQPLGHAADMAIVSGQGCCVGGQGACPGGPRRRY